MHDLDALIDVIRDNLTPDLLPKTMVDLPWPMGYCSVASEALYHLTGGGEGPFAPCVINVDTPEVHFDTHWYLKDKETGEPLDITRDQFPFPLDYTQGVGKGFQTKGPSKRAKVVIERVNTVLGIPA